MKASPWEKMILVMLSDLHQKAGIKDSVDPQLIASAALDDDLWVLAWKYDGLGLDVETPAEVIFVVNVLDMFAFLNEGFGALEPAEQQTVIDQHPHAEAFVQFLGFDGNNEAEYRHIARRLVDDLDRFPSLKSTAANNSHCPMVDAYRRMYSVFETIRPSLVGRGMGVDEINAVLAARAHPGQ